MTALVLAVCPLQIFAQEGHSHTQAPQQQEMAADTTSTPDTLLKVVRAATEKYKDVAMGLHYINAAILNSGILDPTRPQIVIYEPTPGGGKKLIGADFLVFADAWNSSHSAPPQLMGQAFHLFTSPNRFGLPAFYTLHVWAWKENPKGAFVNWHPNVSCQSFAPAAQ
jgi:hypothetical protein